ncbi:nucleolus protein [Boletus reticuloceps]|uniref:25S rRNA adenine-N(1) methyltransferase n=1 Tax=Boletus reticuloceps TaxID=495285 RepID=A0A8I2YX13_9AGAM|nr:nucleolus protein [Boletus reticuloceps]
MPNSATNRTLMRNTRKKKTPVTLTERHHPSANGSSKPHTTRTLIRRFHVLLKRQRQLQKNASSASNAKELQDVEQAIDQLGGLAAYQRMSSIGQGKDRGGGSERVLIKWLIGMGMSKRHDKGPLSLLEVGALRPDNYASCSSWITATPVDLRSTHPSIIEQDFLTMNVDEHTERWDVISLSLVVNFVPDPKDRGSFLIARITRPHVLAGRMLILAHTFLRPSGLLFLALPSPCVENSRYMSFERLQSLMSTIGFVGMETKWRQGGKMAYWLYRKTRGEGTLEKFQKKSVCRQGARNNFCIVLS